MPEITYESIKPLIVKADQQGRSMRCTFRCPVSGFTVDASAVLQKSAGREMAARAGRTVKQRLLFTARGAVSRAIFRSVGRNIVGQVGRDLAHTAMMEVGRGAAQPSFSNAEKRDAVVAAFERVAAQFVWDERNRRWVSARVSGETLTDFDQQLQSAPVTQRYDHGVLARMLTELMNIDNQIRPEEKAFLADFISSDVVGSVNDLLRRPLLSKIELDETTQGAARETMLMLAWALALSDEELVPGERDRLQFYAEALQIPQERADELVKYAQSFIVDEILDQVYAGGKVNVRRQQQFMELATSIGMTDEEAQRADVRYRKRAGIV